MDEIKLKHIQRICIAAVAIGVILLGVSIGNAFFSGESTSEKLQRLETQYSDQIEIIVQAEEVIEKQYDIKSRAEDAVKSITIDLATLKSQVEMEKDEPDMNEVKRLSEKAALYASELGN